MENYKITCQNGKTRFELSDSIISAGSSFQEINAALLDDGWIAFSHLGDPELLSCSAYRKKDAAGGVFLLRGLHPLLIAKADSNLAFTMALGRFAGIVANARYASDIWNEMDGSDD